MKNKSQFLPLLQIVAEIEPQKRQLLLEHLDAKASDAIVECVKLVLAQGLPTMPEQHISRLKKCVPTNRVAFKHVLSKRKRNKGNEKTQATLTIRTRQ